MTNQPIDLVRTAALGDPATEAGRAALSEIFRLYFDTASAACAEIRRGGSPEQLRKHAHRAKGASGVVGAVALSAAFADLESRAAAGETLTGDQCDEINARLAELKHVVSMSFGLELP